MKIVVYPVVALLALLAPRATDAQGFDWEYSMRMPSDYPSLFVRTGYAFGLVNDVSRLSTNTPSLSCADFTDGGGQSHRISIGMDYWVDGYLSVFATLGFERAASDFSDVSAPITFRSGGRTQELVRRFDLSAQMALFNVELGLRRRIMSTHAFLGGSVSVMRQLSQTIGFSESISQPAEFASVFEYEPPSDLQLSKTLGGISVLGGYDVNIGRGRYASPYLGLTYILGDVGTNAAWTRVVYSLGLSISGALN